MEACFAWESIARPAVTLSPSNANSAQNGAACCQSPRMDGGHVQVISILMKRERPVIYFRGNTGKTLQPGTFPFSLHLDFLFELNEVCM